MLKRKLITLILAAMLSACGGSESVQDNVVIEDNVATPQPEATVYTGVFVDSAVQNLHYTTATQDGTTNVDGEFNYQLNELVTFSIGDIEFPAVAASALLTPLTLFNTDDINQVAVVNMLRLIQSLDVDGNPSNGIEISDAVHQLAIGVSLDFSGDDFVSVVNSLVEMSGAGTQTLVGAVDAVAHFEQTLIDLGLEPMGFCAKTHGNIGHSGYFSSIAHNVSGKATIIDDCTIEITEFYYDGGGPDVYIYGAIDHQYSNDDAFAIGEKLSGTAFESGSMTLRLPNDRTLDDLTGLSVWCVDFNADFGHLEFTP